MTGHEPKVSFPHTAGDVAAEAAADLAWAKQDEKEFVVKNGNRTPRFSAKLMAESLAVIPLIESYLSNHTIQEIMAEKGYRDPRDANWDLVSDAVDYAIKARGHYVDIRGINNVSLTIYRAKRDLSVALHENLRKDIEDGFSSNGQPAETPRLRPSKDKTGEKDKAWFAAQEAKDVKFTEDENGNKLVNTNVPYKELPPSWQEASSSAANFVVDTIAKALANGETVMSNDYVEKASSAVHDKWMADNAWQQESAPELFVPYAELPENEKEKDRDQILMAISHFVQ